MWFEDYDLWVRMLQKGYKAANMPEYLVNVRADKNMFDRRGGVRYLKQEIKFEKYLLKINFINTYQFVINLFIRSIVRLLPNNVRSIFYNIMLRNKVTYED